MFDLDSLKSIIPTASSPILTPKDFLAAMGGGLASTTMLQLLMYRKRHTSKNGGDFHHIYRSGGVYLIEFENNIYIGSTGTDTMYFGRRWRLHLTNEHHRCLVPFMKDPDPHKVAFHVLALSETQSVSLFLEYATISFAEKCAGHLLINPVNPSTRKQRSRNPVSEGAWKRQTEINRESRAIAKLVTREPLINVKPLGF